MPITRRKRATPPDQPENAANNHVADQPEAAPEVQALPAPTQDASTEASAAPLSMPQEEEGPANTSTTGNKGEQGPYQPSQTPSNGERFERQEYTPSIEGGRRTARGELFRRPPQPPPATPVVPGAVVPTLQPPSHEIKLPLGRETGDSNGDSLHLAYNPGYTGSDEVRSVLLHQLAQESKSGGRARCWNCGSLAIVYDRWNTRNKNFGEIGIAYCEICGVWSVM